jgi:hypothetical protein
MNKYEIEGVKPMSQEGEATLKPFVPPMIKSEGTLVIQAGSINLW